jgi:Bacterial Ig-like domain (group 3)
MMVVIREGSQSFHRIRFRSALQKACGIFGASICAAALVPTPAYAAANDPFTTLASGLTQSLYATGTPGIGGVAFAPNGDPLVVAGSIFRVDSTTTVTVDGSAVHPVTFTAASVILGVVNGANGALYANMSSGVEKIDASGNVLAGPAGTAGSGLGITVDPQTGNLVYPATDGNLDWVSEDFTSSGVFVANAFSDGLIFEPGGNYLFAAVFGNGINEYNRAGALVQSIPNASAPDGMAFHAGTPHYLVSNNNDGSITRYDFPNGDYTQAPTQSVLASGGFRGDLSQVGTDGCLYVTQNGTRFADGTVTSSGSLVQICPGFIPPAPVPTTVTVSSATGDYADATTVSAVLTNTSTGNPVAAESIAFKLNGSESCSATTDATGTASCSITPGEAAGTYSLTANFLGDGSIQPSNGSGSFVVNHEQTALAYTGASSATNGQAMTMSGVLTTDDPSANSPLGSKMVTFTLGSGVTAQTCTGTTDLTGSASCTISAVSQSVGAVAIAVAFGGDTFYASASTSATANVASGVSHATLGLGWWKNHQAQTTALLPQTLGSYVVSTSPNASAVLTSTNCSNSSSQNAVGCLAGQLLVAELNLANGAASPACATTAVSQAKSFLIAIGYSGPTGTYSLTASQRLTAVGLATTLDNYSSGSATC